MTLAQLRRNMGLVAWRRAFDNAEIEEVFDQVYRDTDGFGYTINNRLYYGASDQPYITRADMQEAGIGEGQTMDCDLIGHIALRKIGVTQFLKWLWLTDKELVVQDHDKANKA